MRREVRIHGSTVKLSKNLSGAVHGRTLFGKPVSHSKCHFTLRPIRVDPGNMPGTILERQRHDQPRNKAVGKTAGTFKEKSMDIKKSFVMLDWSVNRRDRKNFVAKDFRDHDYESEHSDCEDEYAEVNDDVELHVASVPGQRVSEIVVPFDSFILGSRSRR